MQVLSRPVLVLNRGWTPIAVITVEKAINLVANSARKRENAKAKIIDHDLFCEWDWDQWTELKPEPGEDVIRSARQSFRVPQIIVLKYAGYPCNKARFSKRTIKHRDNHTCVYCGQKPGAASISLDHIIPRSQGGETSWINCVLACTLCNRDKAAHMPDKTFIVEKDKDGKEHSVPAFIVYFNSNRFPGKKVVIKQPSKPKSTLYKGEFKYKSWGVLFENLKIEDAA